MKEFKELNDIYMIYIIGVFFSWNIISLYFVNLGFSFPEIASYYLLFSISSLITIISLTGLRIADSIRMSQLLRILSIVTVMYFFSKVQLYLAGILIGITVELFWIPYYTRYEQFAKYKTEKNRDISFLLKILAPLAGGFIAAKFGFIVLFGVTVILYAINLVKSGAIDRKDKIIFSWIDAISKTGGIKVLVLLEGIWQTFPFMIVPLITTNFIRDELLFGGFLCYLAAFTFIGFYTTKKTNISQKINLLYPLTFITGILTIISGASEDFTAWAVMIGCTTLIWKLTEPLTTSLILVKTRNFERTVVARRFFIALGRIIGSALSIIVFISFKDARYSVIPLGLMFLIYPFILYKNKDKL